MTTHISRCLAVSTRANATVEAASLAIAYVRTWRELVADGKGRGEVVYKLNDARTLLRGAWQHLDALLAEIEAEVTK